MRNLSCDYPSVTHGQSHHVRLSPMKHPTAAVPCSTLLSLAVLCLGDIHVRLGMLSRHTSQENTLLQELIRPA